MAEIVVALDLPGAADALRLLDRLPDVRWVKVGSVLMTRDGRELLGELTGRGLRIFLDLKWHDIPNTVAGAVSAAREFRVAMATVHTLGGRAMLEAAAQAAGPELAIVGVTVLTSHDSASFGATLGRETPDVLVEVERLADSAMAAGLAGVVCSPQEAARVRARVGSGPIIVVPGIRRPGDAAGDQKRTAAPAEAVRSGATHLVVGRPILQAPDPAAAFRDIAEAAEAR